MKKIQVVALGAFVTLGALFTSCGGNVSTNVSLKTDIDTISYAYGASIYEQGLSGILQQVGLAGDTAAIRGSYLRQIEAESDAAKKTSLEKEMKHKLDSVSKATERNVNEFLKGLQEAVNAPESQKAYMIGLSVGSSISGQMFPGIIQQVYGPDSKEKINSAAFIAAVATAFKKDKFIIENPAAKFQMKMQEAQMKAQEKRDEELKKQYEPQIKAGEAFLAENKTKEGVVTLPSGIQYKVVKEGTGVKPLATDIVKVNYKGTLIDGTVFDSSEGKEPATFNVSGVIKGWTEVLQLMPAGSTWTVYIPYDLAYGAQERGEHIKPFSTLIFDVELLEVNPK
ncbi:FKBP-type peptidyl-prolyl cis-trans isomerase [Dysgonomonas sp.]|jgi:FKBP-type peptidyl-prolyl cis-trans isomerase FklB